MGMHIFPAINPAAFLIYLLGLVSAFAKNVCVCMWTEHIYNQRSLLSSVWLQNVLAACALN